MTTDDPRIPMDDYDLAKFTAAAEQAITVANDES